MNPIIRAAISGAFGSRDLSFFAPLRTSLVPARGTGSATYTRATTATVFGHEGVLRTVKSGEARFQGARRVENLITSSGSMVGAPWTYVSSASGTANSVTFAAIAASGLERAVTITGGTANNAFAVSAKISVASGTAGFRLKCTHGDVLDYVSPELVATTTPTVYSFTQVFGAGAGNFNVIFGIINSATAPAIATLQVEYTQLENVTGQSVQTAGEYVSNGVLSSPWHGAGVDGVRYFDTTLAEVPIPAATLLGYLAEGARTNLITYSRALTPDWAFATATTVANNVIGIDGAANSGVTVTCSATSHNRGQTRTVTASTVYTFSFYAQRGTMTDAKYSVYDITAGANIIAPTSYYSQINSSGYSRVIVTFTTPVGCTQASVYVVRDSQVTGTVLIDAVQLELGAFASSPIHTTTAAVTRNADVLTYPHDGGVIGSLYCELLPTAAAPVSLYPGVALDNGGSTGKIGFYMSTGGLTASAFVRNTTTQSEINSGALSLSVPTKLAMTYQASMFRSANAGVLGTSDISGSVPATTRLNLSHLDNEWFGTIRNVRIYNRAFSNAELQALTS